MDLIVFMAVVGAVTVIGVGLGLALAPRLSRWDERRNRGAEKDRADEGGEDDRD
ncbi:MAG TPA: hypothetical protein VLM76_01160 [Patescibacteria group bacterium]|nr:hypothetical protein [Patescibacteria group bacterium]